MIAMEHLAILSSKLNLFGKILSGEKSIESRWYFNRKTPYKNIFPGETIYFKEGGRFAKAVVEKALFFEVDDARIKELLLEYGDRIGAGIEYFENVKGKRYVTLVFIRDAAEVKPFYVPFSRAAWITKQRFP